MKRMSAAVSILALALGAETAFAQATPPMSQPTPPAMAQPTAPSVAQPGKAGKQSVSKMCSDQADAKGLHGKERKKFRLACRANGGKPS